MFKPQVHPTDKARTPPPLLSGTTRDTPAILDPICELLALFPNIHKPRPSLKYLERVPNIVLVHLALVIHKALLSFALNLASPHAPFDRS